MQRYHHILVAVDGSDEADKAFRRAAKMAVEHGARFIITYVVRTGEPMDRFLLSKIENYGRRLVERYKKEAEHLGIENVRPVVDFGSPRSKIPKTIAKEYNADLIVVGATGINAVGRFLVGSVTDAMMRHAPCDVLVVRNGKNKE